MKIFQAFSLLTIAHGSKVTRINFRKEGEGLGSRLISSALIAGASIAGDSGPSVVSGGTPAGSGGALMAVNSGVGSGELIQQLTQLV